MFSGDGGRGGDWLGWSGFSDRLIERGVGGKGRKWLREGR